MRSGTVFGTAGLFIPNRMVILFIWKIAATTICPEEPKDE